MTRLVAIVALVATGFAVDALASPPYSATVPRGCRNRSCARGRVVASSSSAAPAVPSIQNAIQAGDKAGNWWALKTDGTMLASSSLTMTGHGSPGTSPMTFNGTTQYFESGDVDYPTGDFSVVTVINPTTNVAQYAVSKWTSTSVFICGVDTTALFYLESAAPLFQSVTSVATVPAGSWVGICCTYNGLANQIHVRVGGVTATASAAGNVQAGTKPHNVGATFGGANPTTGSSRGAFFTEKTLSDSDCDRIIAGAM